MLSLKYRIRIAICEITGSELRFVEYPDPDCDFFGINGSGLRVVKYPDPDWIFQK